jgi:hypothetical protein
MILRVKAVSSIPLHLQTVNKGFHQTTSHLLLDNDSGQRIYERKAEYIRNVILGLRDRTKKLNY